MLFFDIETDGFLPDLTKIHCINIYDSEKWSHERYDPANLPISLGLERLRLGKQIAGHSIIDFDIPAIRKLNPGWEPRGELIDTKVLARLVWPNIRDYDFGNYQKGRLPKAFMQLRLQGTHKLEAWGYRLRVYKGDFAKHTDWKTWSPAMSNYCEQDVVVTIRLYEKVISKNPSQEAMKIETEVEKIIYRQMRNGISFDKRGGEKLYLELLNKRERLREELTHLFPPFYKPGKLFTPKRDMRKRADAWVGYVAGAACQKIELVDFNPASGQHIAMMLTKKYGWEPVEFTLKTGEPKIDDEILQKLEYPEAKQLAKFLTLNKRIGQISEGKEAWLKHVREDGRIYGAVNPMGAYTRRMAHFKPNLAQVPAIYSLYGKECRELFGPRKGWVQVGIDADGLEMACLSHFMEPYDDGEFIKVLKEGDKKKGTDQHSLNAKILNLSRDDAKTWFYAYCYGAGNGKLGAIAKTNAAYGGKMRRKFETKLPALAALVDALKAKARSHGYLLSLDKHPMPTRTFHSVISTLCQGAGAVIMKKALVILDEWLQKPRAYQVEGSNLPRFENPLKPGVDYEFMLNIHDEWQIECRPELADDIGISGCWAITKAGEHFNFRCPLSGSYKVGKNWAETH